MSSQPTESEIASAVATLKKLHPGLLPYPLFKECTRLCVTPILELVPLRNVDNPEVLLLRRPSDDDFWPSMQHTPGTVLRPTDYDFSDAINRVFENEIGKATDKIIKLSSIINRTNRGIEHATIFIADYTGIPVVNGVWHSIHSLPDNLVDSQKNFILEAIANFKYPR